MKMGWFGKMVMAQQIIPQDSAEFVSEWIDDKK